MNQRTKLTSALLAFALVFSLAAWSQETHPAKSESGQTAQDLPAYNSAQKMAAEANKQNPERYFKLTFRVLDLSAEGKVTNSRSYSETIVTKGGRTSSIRTGDRVPIATSVNTGNTSSLVNTQYQYIDIGTKIDAADIEFIDQTLHLYVTADISAIASVPPAKASLPIVRQTKWNSYVTVPINKPALIFSADNSADKGKTELELTAVPINQ